MGCVGCPASQGETVEEASMVHGLNPDEVIDYVNHVLEEKLAE
jgi:hybrid cluster-associated redox disulfide protein